MAFGGVKLIEMMKDVARIVDILGVMALGNVNMN
jgi:hypothetical protein